MADDPCKHLHDEYIAAMNEWVAASSAAQSWAVTKPLSLDQDITPRTTQQTEQMMADFNRDEQARKTYLLKMDAYMECRRRARPSSKP